MLEINMVHNLDCLEGLKQLEDNSVDSIVTDPPYELGFMGKSWDSTGIAYKVEVWRECLRVLKPGGHLLSFGGTRTYHRMVCAIEDAGFEIRDQIQWIYSQGFPKSHNISKAIDKRFGAEREVVGYSSNPNGNSGGYEGERYSQKRQTKFGVVQDQPEKTAPAIDEAKQYDGWGTALKPANEPIVVARKPLSERTVVDNVLKWGTGGINIDECRVETTDNLNGGRYADNKKGDDGCTYGSGINKRSKEDFTQPEGRFPANVILDEEAGQMLDEQSGTLKSGGGNKANRKPESRQSQVPSTIDTGEVWKVDSGGASRFFMTIKNDGCDDLFGSILESQKVDGMLSGVSMEIEKYIQNAKQDGYGNKNMEKFQRGMKFIIKMVINLMIELKISDCYQEEYIESCMEKCEKIIGLLMELSIGDVRFATIISHLESFIEEMNAIKDTAKNVQNSNFNNGDQKTEKDGMNIIENTENNSRFFYSAKATKKEKGEGNNHPTVKPIKLMEYLVRLVTPKGGTVLDPFAGSGTTLLAAKNEGMNYIGFELEEEYIEIINERLLHVVLV